MKNSIKLTILVFISIFLYGCKLQYVPNEISASDILGNDKYLAISYGGYRGNSRDIQPTIAEIKEDLKIMFAMNIKVLRTYNTKLAEAPNLLKAISELKKEDPNFEMYVMLGAWIDCENAWTDHPNHEAEDVVANTGEIERAVALANQYPDIVKIISVGNEAMVHWASSYYVSPKVILKWVNYLQELKNTGKLHSELWITSSDNFASWGGGDNSYHTDDLVSLMKTVDYISLHTYPFHDTHYNPVFWRVPVEEKNLSNVEKAEKAIERAVNYAISQYQSAAEYMNSLGIIKPIHIGETGWSTKTNSMYGEGGSGATDEYKSKLYYDAMRDWTNRNDMSCFYFEAFDEQWKDANNPLGSENHFGLINLKSEAKYMLWDLVDKGVFKGLTRDGKPITKTYNGDKTKLLNDILSIPVASDTLKK